MACVADIVWLNGGSDVTDKSNVPHRKEREVHWALCSVVVVLLSDVEW